MSKYSIFDGWQQISIARNQFQELVQPKMLTLTVAIYSCNLEELVNKFSGGNSKFIPVGTNSLKVCDYQTQKLCKKKISIDLILSFSSQFNTSSNVYPLLPQSNVISFYFLFDYSFLQMTVRGHQMAKRVCKCVFLQVFGCSCQLLQNYFFDQSTPFMKKVDNRERGKNRKKWWKQGLLMSLPVYCLNGK